MSSGMHPAARLGVLAYGDDGRRHREAAVALLTIKAFAPDTAEVVVFTDRPARYRWLMNCVSVEALAPDTIKRWRGPSDDRFRPKIETLRVLSSGGVHALLADTDTMARASLLPLLAHLQSGGYVLYEREYRIAAPPRRGDRLLLRDIVGRRWADIPADDRTWMWNGGVIGVSGLHHGVADQALNAFDEMRAASRHFALEQLAYSIVFPAYGAVRAASESFIHYWANRAWFDRRVDSFLADVRLEDLTAAAASERLRERPIDGPLDGRRSSWQRRVGKLFGIKSGDDHERID